MSLVRYYGVSVADLIPEDRSGAAPAPDGKSNVHELLHSRAEGVRMFLLAPDTHRQMMPVLTVFEPGARTLSPAVHEGEEFVYVLDGTIGVTIATVERVLSRGESLFFDAREPHGYRNAGEGVARMIGVASPPSL
jgi:quercetin dioxygenase-like cupin family protein